MLILSRRRGEKIIINGDIVIEIRAIGRDHVKVAIEAPKSVSVNREEVHDRITKEMDKEREDE